MLMTTRNSGCDNKMEPAAFSLFSGFGPEYAAWLEGFLDQNHSLKLNNKTNHSNIPNKQQKTIFLWSFHANVSIKVSVTEDMRLPRNFWNQDSISFLWVRNCRNILLFTPRNSRNVLTHSKQTQKNKKNQTRTSANPKTSFVNIAAIDLALLQLILHRKLLL